MARPLGGMEEEGGGINATKGSRKEKLFFSDLATKRGEGVQTGPLRKKRTFFEANFFTRKSSRG